METVLKFEKREVKEAVVISTVAKAVGPKGRIDFSLANLQRDGSDGERAKAVTVFLTRADGKSVTVICSKAISAAIRNKELSAPQIGQLEIIEHERRDDNGQVIDVIPMIVSPRSGVQGTVGVEAAAFAKAEAFVPVSRFADISELIAL